jgi:trimeric autotransporter adhesin
MFTNVNGSANTAGGYVALYNNKSGSANTAIGYGALVSNDANFNTTVGVKALTSNTSGEYNSSLGAYSLNNNINGNNNTAVGTFADVAGNSFNNATAVGNGAVVQNSDLVQLGDANVTQIECWTGVYTNTSDGRFKFKISEEDVKGLDFIKRLRPVVYNMDTKKLTEYMTKNLSEEARKAHLNKNFDKSTSIRQSGFIAQEVEIAAKEAGYDFHGVQKPKDENGHYSLAYAQFVVPLVKAVQEQQQIIEGLLREVSELKKGQSNNAEASMTTGIKDGSLISNSSLEQNIPNPFTNETVINYNLSKEINSASLFVYDLSGKQIASFPIKEKGTASMTITSEKLAAGMYIYSIVADGKLVDSKRMIVAEK